MSFPRDTESLIRQLLEVLPLVDEPTPEAILARLEQLQRGLEPENEFALILSWLGQCRLVHKLGQEQLPLNSSKGYRVPDLLAVFGTRRKGHSSSHRGENNGTFRSWDARTWHAVSEPNVLGICRVIRSSDACCLEEPRSLDAIRDATRATCSGELQDRLR